MAEHKADSHPIDSYLKKDRLPHIWCSGCGIGNVVTAYIEALKEARIDRKYAVVVSGIGCSSRTPGYLNQDTFHTTHGRPIPFAIGMKLANPKLNVSVISGDGDLFAIGSNHFLHAARRNADMLVICINNYNYGMTGGQLGPTTPIGGITTTSVYGNIEQPLNLPYIAAASGSCYVARWSSIDVRRLIFSIAEALNKKGFRFIEVLSPCPTVYGRRNKMRETLDMPKFFLENTIIMHNAEPSEVSIEEGKKIILGKFLDIERETFDDNIEKIYRRSGNNEK
ncbi:MAG: thiamine pyrophosphate-dependent enzyme [Candidatus Thermoplasmatota archaeon]